MIKGIVAAAFGMLLSTAAVAQTEYRYDWRSGNSYTIDRDDDGEVTVYGRNRETGSRWRNSIEPNGNQHGVDAAGNRWRYNSATGVYRNSDGTECRGRGPHRSCVGGD